MASKYSAALHTEKMYTKLHDINGSLSIGDGTNRHLIVLPMSYSIEEEGVLIPTGHCCYIADGVTQILGNIYVDTIEHNNVAYILEALETYIAVGTNNGSLYFRGGNCSIKNTGEGLMLFIGKTPLALLDTNLCASKLHVDLDDTHRYAVFDYIEEGCGALVRDLIYMLRILYPTAIATNNRQLNCNVKSLYAVH